MECSLLIASSHQSRQLFPFAKNQTVWPHHFCLFTNYDTMICTGVKAEMRIYG